MKKHFRMLLFLACACVFSAVPAMAGENVEFPGAELQLMEFNGRTHATHHFIGPDAGGAGKSKNLTGNGADFVEGNEYITSYGTWKFTTAEGKLTATKSDSASRK